MYLFNFNFFTHNQAKSNIYYHLPPLTPNKLLLPPIMTDYTHTDFTCSSCNTIAMSLTGCDYCRKWLCQSCYKLPKSTLNLQNSGFYWFCTKCRSDHKPSQCKILSKSISQTYPMSSPPIYNNHSPAPAPAPHLSPQPTFSTSSLLTPPPNPSSQTIH